MKPLLLVILLLGAGSLHAHQNVRIHPFTTDGCSMAPDGNFRSDWTECCTDHDFAYWLGGTSAERAQADNRLKACIADKSNAATAEVYFRAVRIGGTAYSITNYRWGYGWNYIRSYRAISEQEKELIKNQLGQSLEDIQKNYKP